MMQSAGGCRVVSGVADLAQGKGPTITQGADGTLQVLTNNNSGDEVQFQRDGTLTWVNGGNAPGIFSVSLQTPLQLMFPDVCNETCMVVSSTLQRAQSPPSYVIGLAWCAGGA